MPEPFDVGSIDWMDNTAMKGHTLGHSVADLIDNSIDANSDLVDVVLKIEQFPTNWRDINQENDVLSFYIIDDGDGIDPERLEKVLSVQRRRDADGNEAYHETHLGAFGLGVPTSTLSQGSHITLMSKKSMDQEVSFAAISRLDRYKHNRATILKEDDLRDEYPHLLETEMFREAYDELSTYDQGTVILVQYLHRNCYAADNLAELRELRDVSVSRLRAYLGLVFEHYINGVDLVDHQGQVHQKKIILDVLGTPVPPIDPLMQNHRDPSRDGVFGTHINHGENLAPVSGRQREFTVSVAVVPGANSQGGQRPVSHDEKMKLALAMRREGSGEEGAPITDCQGLYLYRNMRLIEFGTWKGIYTGGANYTCARVAVYGPIGFNVSDQSLLFSGSTGNEGFTCDPSKITVNMSPLILRRVKAIIDDEHQWHRLDDSRKKAYTRANGRIAYDRRMYRPPTPPPPRIPIVSIELSCSEGPPPLEVEIRALNSGPVNATEFTWIIDGETYSGQELSHIFETEGNHSITLQGSAGDVTSRPSRTQVMVRTPATPIPPPAPTPRAATIDVFDDPNADLIRLDISLDGEMRLFINTGSEYFREFVNEFVDRFGE